MKTIRHILLAAGILAAGTASTQAASHLVLPGQDLQSIIDGAASGDLITLAPMTTGGVTVTGKNLTLRGIGASRPSIGSLTATGCKLTVIGLQFGGLTIDDSAGQAAELIAFRCAFGSLETRAAKATIQYSDLARLYVGKKAVVVDCDLDGGTTGGVGIDVNGTAALATIRNSRIHDYSLNANWTMNEECIGIRVRNGATAEIRNNLIWACKDTIYQGTETDCGMGVFVKEGSHAVILGNVIWDCYVAAGTSTPVRGHRLVYAPVSTVVRHNILWKNPVDVHGTLVGGGVTPSGTINADPKFVGGDPYDYHLQATSPAKDAGPPEARYFDHDGTRNDIGMYGGREYLPNGRTTNKPVVLSLEASPIAVPAGGVITIQSSGAIVK